MNNASHCSQTIQTENKVPELKIAMNPRRPIGDPCTLSKMRESWTIGAGLLRICRGLHSVDPADSVLGYDFFAFLIRWCWGDPRGGWMISLAIFHPSTWPGSRTAPLPFFCQERQEHHSARSRCPTFLIPQLLLWSSLTPTGPGPMAPLVVPLCYRIVSITGRIFLFTVRYLFT